MLVDRSRKSESTSRNAFSVLARRGQRKERFRGDCRTIRPFRLKRGPSGGSNPTLGIAHSDGLTTQCLFPTCWPFLQEGALLLLMPPLAPSAVAATAPAPSTPSAPSDAVLANGAAANIGAPAQGTVTFWPRLTSTVGELGLVGFIDCDRAFKDRYAAELSATFKFVIRHARLMIHVEVRTAIRCDRIETSKFGGLPAVERTRSTASPMMRPSASSPTSCTKSIRTAV